MNDDFNNGKIFCTKCGAQNKVGYRFCVRCGAKLVVPVSRQEPEISQELPKTEPVRSESVKFEPEPAAFEQEPVKTEPVTQKFGVFEETAPQEQPVAPEPAAFELESMTPEQEPITFEPEPVEQESAPQTFSAFEQTPPQEKPVMEAGFAGNDQAVFEAEPKREFSGFARSGFTGATTPTAAAGAFATAVDAVKNNKQIDVSDAETVMSLLEQGESSALTQGLPDWDIVPPQVVVRRKRRV